MDGIKAQLLRAMTVEQLDEFLAKLNRTRRPFISLGLNGQGALVKRAEVRAAVLAEIKGRLGISPVSNQESCTTGGHLI